MYFCSHLFCDYYANKFKFESKVHVYIFIMYTSDFFESNKVRC